MATTSLSSTSSATIPQRQVLPQLLPTDVLVHIFSFLLLSQKNSVVRLSKELNQRVIQQTKSAIDTNYRKLLTLLMKVLGQQYWLLNSRYANLLLTDLIPKDATNLRAIRTHLSNLKHTFVHDLQSVEEIDRNRLNALVNPQDKPRLQELFRIMKIYEQFDSLSRQGKLEEATDAALKIDNLVEKSLLLETLAKAQLYKIPRDIFGARKASDLIPDPQIKKRSQNYIDSNACAPFDDF